MFHPPVQIENPFAAALPAGKTAHWVLRSIEDPTDILSDPMDHFDAMRCRLDHHSEILSRADRLDEPLVHGLGYDDRWLTAPTSVDVTPALEQLEMQDFVEMLSFNFEDCDAPRKVLSILNDQGDPRAERLKMYEGEWSTPDENGNRAQACLRIDQESLMAWCEKERPDIFEELKCRIDAANLTM